MVALARQTSRRKADEIQMRIIYLMTLPAFVLAASLGRLLPGRRSARSSILREAKAAAKTCGSFALMG